MSNGSADLPSPVHPEASRAWGVVDSSPDGMIIVDHAGDILVVNRQIETMFGYSRDEIIGRSIDQLVPIRHRESHRTHRTLYNAQPTVRSMGSGLELWAERSDGTEFPVEISLSPISDDDGDAVIGTVRDVSERFAAEAKMRELQGQIAASEAAFRAAFEDGPVGMLTARLNGADGWALERVNTGFCAMLGYAPNELIGFDLSELTHPDDTDIDRQAVRSMKSGAHAQYVAEKRYRRADGTYLWVLLHSTIVDDAHGDLVLGHVLDISDRHAAEAERDRQQLWLRSLVDVRTALLSDAPTTEALHVVCRHACQIGVADIATIAMSDPTEEHLKVIAVHGEAPPLGVGESVPDDDLVDEVLESTRTSLLEIGANDRPRSTFGNSPQKVMIAPFGSTSHQRGILILNRRVDDRPFDATDVRMVESFTLEVAASFELAQSRIDAARLKRLEDREHIGQDLHDVVIQRLFATGMSLQGALGLPDRHVVDDRIRGAVGSLDDAIRELRSAIFGMSVLEEPIRLTERVLDIVEEHVERLGFEPEVSLASDTDSASLTVTEQLASSLHEALSNIARHAHASSAVVSVEVDSGEVILTVSDDGVGLSDGAVRGNGLDNLEARAARVGGRCTIEQSPGGGTLLVWRAPL